MTLLWWAFLAAAGLVALGWLAGVAVRCRHWLVRRRGPRGCPSVSTVRGRGRDVRPDGLRCYHRPGHRGLHCGFDPATDTVHYWAQP